MARELKYMTGFGNTFESEALAGALPIGRNSPQKVPFGLYTEQLSGSPFTAPQHENERSWLYRIRPSVRHMDEYRRIDAGLLCTAPPPGPPDVLAQMRWNPEPLNAKGRTFVSGLRTYTVAGDHAGHSGMAAHVATVTASMKDEYFFNADGELLIVMQQGKLSFHTEFGIIDLAPGEICVIPRGVVFKAVLPGSTPARAYVCENYGGKLTLPNRGPIGANCLANPRDFETPVACYEEKDRPARMLVKWYGALYEAEIDSSPLDVVAWHGNYAPYKYDLRRFSPVNAVSFDHPDPSIFTVLTSPTETEGTANIDFVIFPERWSVAENTFRPPWYHRNIMSEFMGLIYGVYDAKPQGFKPGCISLHNRMLPHGPDRDAYDKAISEPQVPVRMKNTLAFMFESLSPQMATEYATDAPTRQRDYVACWSSLRKNFRKTKKRTGSRK